MSDESAIGRLGAGQLRVTVVSAAAPQLDHLAGVLDARGQLARLIHPYIRTGSRLERTLEAAPVIGAYVRRELGRRSFVDIKPARLQLVGTGFEFVRALLSRGALGRLDLSRRLQFAALWRMNKQLSRTAILAAADSDALVASYGVALDAFQTQRGTALKVLDYPIAHHEYSRRLLDEEARLRPEMASTLQFNRWPRWVTDQWDQECAAADLILVGSAFVKGTFLAQGFRAHKLAISPYGVDVRLFSPNPIPPEIFRALFIGQIGQRKGIAYLLDAWALVRRRGIARPCELVLVGPFVGDARAVLASRDLFRHVPTVPRPALPSIYRTGSVLVLPSLIEGMPLVVLEAMACGLPVIVTPAAAGDVVRDGVEGFVVPVRDHQTIADRLMQLAADRPLSLAMGEAARRRALEYTWDAYAERVLDQIVRRLRA